MASGRISQETFDAAVAENMEAFEMSAEEAVAETVSQFEAQVTHYIYAREYFN